MPRKRDFVGRVRIEAKLDRVIELLELAVDEDGTEEDDDEGSNEDNGADESEDGIQLEAMDYHELRSLAGEYDDIDGNASREELIEELREVR
jgi:hypothetical protein